MTSPADILVVGAGPTGLSLALQAHDHGARVRIVERRPEAFRPSRALIVHPRTLEVLRPLGVTDALLARANTAPTVSLHHGRRTVRLHLGTLELPDTAFPHLTLIRQMDVERVLIAALHERGLEVSRGVEAIGVQQGPNEAGAILQTESSREAVACSYIVGCDGQESRVRRDAEIAWAGGRYNEEVVLADAELDTDLEPDVAHVVAGRDSLLLVFALGERATWRLLVTRPAKSGSLPFGRAGPGIPVHELQDWLDKAGLEARITDLPWSARYRVQHRLAQRLRRGRIFLAGDAAHAFSPATGQGMNTGIQDALNLGWKLAYAATAAEREVLLTSYGCERQPVIRRTLALTHLAFWAEASTGPLAAGLRDVTVPLGAWLAPGLLRHRRLVGEAVAMVSQLRTAYRDSPLSMEGEPWRGAGPRAGHRLPDGTVSIDGRQTRLHAALARPGVHVLLHRDAPPGDHLGFDPQVTIHRLTSTPGKGIVAVRPDGYIGFRSRTGDVSLLHDWPACIGAIARRRNGATGKIAYATPSLAAIDTGTPPERRYSR